VVFSPPFPFLSFLSPFFPVGGRLLHKNVGSALPGRPTCLEWRAAKCVVHRLREGCVCLLYFAFFSLSFFCPLRSFRSNCAGRAETLILVPVCRLTGRQLPVWIPGLSGSRNMDIFFLSPLTPYRRVSPRGKNVPARSLSCRSCSEIGPLAVAGGGQSFTGLRPSSFTRLVFQTFFLQFLFETGVVPSLVTVSRGSVSCEFGLPLRSFFGLPVLKGSSVTEVGREQSGKAAPAVVGS